MHLFLLDLNLFFSLILLTFIHHINLIVNIIAMVMVTGHEDGQYYVHISWCHQANT